MKSFVSTMTGLGWKLEEGSGCRGEGGVQMLVFTRGNDERLDAAVTESSGIQVRQYYRGELVVKILTRYQQTLAFCFARQTATSDY